MLRHYRKCEDSSDSSEEDEDLDQQLADLDENSDLDEISRTKGSIGGKLPRIVGSNTDAIEELLVGKMSYDLEDESDRYRLKFNRELTKK